MPTPDMGEDKPAFMDRCIPMVMDDGSAEDQDQAVAMCSTMWEDAQKSAAVTRAYSLLNVKSFDEERREITGIATTPETDMVDDVVEPRGGQFKLPIPFLYQHDSKQPIGHVHSAEVTDQGIKVGIKLAKIEEPGRLKERLDEAWQSIKHGLVRGLSIGFKDMESEPVDKKNPFGGRRFTKWSWLELSAVTIPANQSASILAIKQISNPAVAGQGKASAVAASKSVKLEARKPMAKKSISERIAELEATRAAKSAALTAIDEKVGDEGRTKDEAEQQEFDGLVADIKSIDRELADKRQLEAMNIAAAKPIEVKPESKTYSPVSVTTKANRPAGIGMARLAIAKMAAFKNPGASPLTMAQQFWPSDDELHTELKTAVTAATTTTSGWASQLVVASNIASEFVEYLRPLSTVGRIPGFRRVPFNITIPTQTAGTKGTWVGEQGAKPLGKLTFNQVTLRFAKMAIISVFTEECARFSNPSVEALVRDDLANGLAQYLDEQFFDPSVIEVSNVSPASITNGVDTAAASGSTIDAATADVLAAFENFLGAEIPLDGVVAVMTSTIAARLMMMRNALGQAAFPNITLTGGTWFGVPVYVTSNVGDGRIVFFKPSECLLADDGGVNIDISNQASLQMDDDPTGAAQSLVSLWQTNRIAIRAERFITYKMRRADAVYYITSAAYGENGTA